VDVQLLDDAVEEILPARPVVERRPLELQEEIAYRTMIARQQLGRPHG
jgi:hypothetical protein